MTPGSGTLSLLSPSMLHRAARYSSCPLSRSLGFASLALVTSDLQPRLRKTLKALQRYDLLPPAFDLNQSPHNVFSARQEVKTRDTRVHMDPFHWFCGSAITSRGAYSYAEIFHMLQTFFGDFKTRLSSSSNLVRPPVFGVPHPFFRIPRMG